MPPRQLLSKRAFQILGVCSPYLAVLVGIYRSENGFLAVVLYHLILLICIVALDKSNPFTRLLQGYHRYLGPLCIGGLLPGILILFLWPSLTTGRIKLSCFLFTLRFDETLFIIFALYVCLVNPILEESFWRGCFTPGTLMPNYIDAFFAGFHLLIISRLVKLPYMVCAFLGLAFVGWFFRLIYRHTGGLLIPWLTHLIADAAILFAVWKIGYLSS